MNAAEHRLISIEIDQDHCVSGILLAPQHAKACLALAHGAGAGMTHPFMAAVADGMFERGVATLRYQFPYMEKGSGRPDRPALAQATVRAAVETAVRLTPSLALFAGGKSFGARMTTQAQAEAPLPSVRGLICLGFPLHLPKKPSVERGRHLSQVRIPMLFVQGTRDAMAEMDLLEATVAGQVGAKLVRVEGGVHSFHVLARSGRTDAQVLTEILDDVVAWIESNALP